MWKASMFTKQDAIKYKVNHPFHLDDHDLFGFCQVVSKKTHGLHHERTKILLSRFNEAKVVTSKYDNVY